MAEEKKTGFFGRLFSGLSKTRDVLADGLNSIFSGHSEINDEFYDDLEETMITADLGVRTTEEIIENLKERVRTEKIREPASCRKLLIESIRDKMKPGENAYDFEGGPCVILLIGVNGTGKTTTAGKLSMLYKSEGKKVLLAAADTFRSAAIEQLSVWSERAGVELVSGKQGSDPAAVVFDACTAAKARQADVLIIDTAGRLHNKKNLMEELGKISRIVERELPGTKKETLIVLDGTTGQNALEQVREFNDITKISGIVLTKLDGTSKGGIAVAIQNETKIPVKFIGVGEQIGDFQKFDPGKFVDALFDEKAE